MHFDGNESRTYLFLGVLYIKDFLMYLMLELKIFRNKKNNQLFVPLPRKKLNLKNDEEAIAVKIDLLKHIIKKRKGGLL